MTILTNHGVPVSNSRQWVATLSPNAAGDGWNYIVASYPGGAVPFQWVVLKNLTTTPTETTLDTDPETFPNSLYTWLDQFNTGRTQLRAPNGRIFFPSFRNWTTYYDPSTEAIHQLGPVVETPPIDPNASTATYSASFDTSGILFTATQESHMRPSMVVRTDPTTLIQTIVGYVGDGAQSYTTYGYYIAPDTGTASKFVYVAYGEDPWQLWALNVTTGAAAKLFEVPSTGVITFAEVVGQGWVATMNTAIGSPSNVITKKWCIDGALYDYTVGVPAPSPRSVTPASNPLISAPYLDTSKGIGVVGWRNGPSGAYNYVNYTVDYRNPIQIESLVDAPVGVVGNSVSYNGFFKNDGSMSQWFGPYQIISRGPRLNVGGDIYASGYPNGVLIKYNPATPWDGTTNPLLIGYIGLNGTQYAGIKYSDYMSWAAGAGAQGTVYVCGSRERNGVGSGIGGWNKATNTFFGTYAATGMNTVTPRGMCVLSDLSRVVMSSGLLVPPGSASLFVFDYALNLVFSGAPLAGVADLGQIYDTATSGVITGIRQGAGNSLNLWQYNVITHTLLSDTDLPLTGTLNASQYRRPGTNKVYVTLGTNIVRIDVDSLTAFVVADASAAAPIGSISLAGDGVTMFLSGGVISGVNGAQLYSLRFDDTMAADPFVGHGIFENATLSNSGSITLVADSFAGAGVFSFVEFVLINNGSLGNGIGDRTFSLQNDEGSVALFGQPIYMSGDLRFQLARADSIATSIVVGLTKTRIESIEFGPVVAAGPIEGTTDEWDAVCGTVGGLTFGTVYYLSATIPGRLTSTPPATGCVVPVIEALSDILARIVIGPPVALS